MRSTEAILTSDCPSRGSDRQLFSKKKHPDFRERPFYSLISDLASCTCPEKTTFSNDTAADIQKDGLGQGCGEKNPCFPDRVLRQRIEGISSDGSLDRGIGKSQGAWIMKIFSWPGLGPEIFFVRVGYGRKNSGTIVFGSKNFSGHMI